MFFVVGKGCLLIILLKREKMEKSKILHAFRISEREGQAILTAQERVVGCSDNASRIFANAGCLQKKPFRLL